MIRMNTVMVAGAALGLAGVVSAQDANRSRAYSAELLADAQERSSLLQAGSSGYDDAFFIQSPDGNFRMAINGFTQFRYQLNLQDDSAPDSTVNGFENARTRLNFTGHAGRPELKYSIEGSFGTENVGLGGAPSQASFALKNAFVQYDYDGNWSVRAGQFEAPFLFERAVHDTRQQTIERSNTSRAFDLGFVQGLEATYTSDSAWRARVSFHDGGNSDNTSYADTFGGGLNQGGRSEFALTGRFDYALTGSLDQFDRYSNGAQGNEGLLLGGAVHMQFGDNGAGQFGDNNQVAGQSADQFLFTVDAAYQSGQGWNLAGAFNFRTINTTVEAGPDDTTDVGFLIQGGYFIADDIELYGRFDTIVADAADDFTTITGGANFYPLSGTQALRISGEVQIFADGTNVGNNNAAVVGPSTLYGVANSGDDSSVGFRGQLQLAF